MRRLTTWSRRRFGGALAGAAIAAALGRGPAAAAAKGDKQVHRVAIRRFAFVPATTTIRAGERVEWTNRDAAPHTATARDRSWTTRGLATAATGAVTFPAPGHYAYFCAYHPNMKGEIVVLDRETPAAGAPGAPGDHVHRRSVAMRAPSARARNLAITTEGKTRLRPA